MKTVLDSLIKNDVSKDQISPLRPFDKSILNKHNALCSTPTKNITISDNHQNLIATDADNKENTQPDEHNSTLSSTIDATASTVKINTIFNEANATIDDNSVKESTNKTNIYPLSADVVLENITEVSNEELSIASPVVEVVPKEPETVVTDMVHEVSELIAKALKLTESAGISKEQPKNNQKLPTVALPRPRRSYLPTANAATFKQRMSIVVKTTLNSPARKLATNSSAARRSCLPTTRSSLIGSNIARKSMLPRSSGCPVSATTSKDLKSDVVVPPVKSLPVLPLKCKLCSATFGGKSSLDVHMESHAKSAPVNRNKNSNFCKYCDKKFVLERALHIHLMQNCVKIPPGEKRKLQFTELNHVKKAKLPKLTSGAPILVNENDKPSGKPLTLIEKGSSVGKLNLGLGRQSIATTSATEMPSVCPEPKPGTMAPPSAKKVIKKAAHAGVYRTPTKTVPCHILHSKSQKNSANAPSAPGQD